ncbi:Ubiquinone biosynthesis protein [Puccinia graminis f. sp. tritici]|uniref:4-hydroxy-3-methoxy-5-polyprenylbenzoate decarboxylase n=2 Tax=Puccinia graminis f. sp. tritici TaxID=56615 RepID=E3KA02_PUCGT|nr:uncharacterized protein PGTG_07236 [Puccinia graminis f. sp. tritici CRL 75-36-700-3]EFP80984.1 hypothetical protein PGTG_07236 [Puccinia graminis f. sp. tritici CRL 75-36-700-3]KAA1068928.1 Ubiquinone biosynthesis protein [Puccinia graminis f. sp. tritici]
MTRLLRTAPRILPIRRPSTRASSDVVVQQIRRIHEGTDQTIEAQPMYANHVSLNGFQRTFLAIGSALASLNNPYRADMIAVLSETTGGPFLARLRDQMLADEAGRRLLRDRPRINTSTVDLISLDQLPQGTFGKEYCNWLRWCNVSPDTREPVRFIDSPELAYVMQRYRECHDFYHVISGPFPVNISGEIVVKWVELANMGLPVAGLSAIFGPLRLASEKRRELLRTYVPWALRMGSSCKPLICVEWEKHWETPIDQLKRSLGISEPPLDFKTWMDLQRKQK